MSSSASAPSHASSATWRLGAVIGRRYRLDGELGRGGYGSVFRATRLDDRMPVALKLLASTKRHDETATARFSREAELAARLTSPGTVRVLDHGDAGDGTPFIVFELLEGETLESWLAPRGAVAPGEALFVLLAVLSSLEEAHALGIVHRDIKPANLLVRPGSEAGSVKLLDFGIAKLEDDQTVLTREGFIIGTAAYMAPEQIDGGTVSPATDLYAAALLLAEMITGAPLYEGEPMAICLRKLKEGRVPLPDAVVMSPFGGVIERATRRAAEARYRSAAEMRAALVQTGVAARPLGAPAPAGAPFASTHLAVPPIALAARPGMPAAVLATAAIGAGLAIAGTAAGLLAARSDPEAAGPTAPGPPERVASAPAPSPLPNRPVSSRCDRPPREKEVAAAALAAEARAGGFELLHSGDAFVFFRHAFERTQKDDAEWYVAGTLKKERFLFGSVAIYGAEDGERLDELARQMPGDARVARSPHGGTMVVLSGLSPELEARFRARLCGGT